MVDVAVLPKSAGAVLCVARVGLIAGSQTGEGLVDGCGLDYAVVSELRGGGCGDGEAGRWAFPSGCGGCSGLHAEECGVLCSLGGVVTALLRTLLSRFYDLSLLVSHVETSLQLLSHAWVVCLESRR